MKRIAYILASLPALSETFISTEAFAMADLGHDVVPIILAGSQVQAAQTSHVRLGERAVWLSEVTSRRATRALLHPSRSAPAGFLFALRQRRLRTRSLIWNAAKIASVARARGCEHLHAHFGWAAAAHAIVAARMIGATVSFTTHGADVYVHPEDLPLKLAAADFTVAVCSDLAADLRRQAQSARVHEVHVGVDPEFFRPSPQDVADNGRLLFVGRLVEKKGVNDLLAALAALQPEERPLLDIVGAGLLQDELRKKAWELLPGCVRFLGPRTAEWIAAEGPAYRAFVAPFKIAADGDRDTGPVVVKEAMAMGLPVVATGVMGLVEIVSTGTGILVPPGDVMALAQALRSIALSDHRQRKAMGRRGRERIIARYSCSGQARLLSQLIQTSTPARGLVGRRTTGHPPPAALREV